MSRRDDGTFRCDGCNRLLDGDTIHAAAMLKDLTAEGSQLDLQLCRDYEDASGKIVTGCVNIALSAARRPQATRRKQT